MSKAFKVNIQAPILIVSGGDGSNSSIQATGYNQHGGTGYHGFLKVTNTYGSATNPNKYFRVNSTGQLEIINSAYNSTIFTLTDAGALTIPSTITASSIIKSGGTSSQYLMADGSVTTSTYTPPLTFTSLATGFSIAGGTTSKTLTVSNTITLAGTDGTTITLPSTSGTVALNPTTTTGDLIYSSSTATPGSLTRLGIGTAGQALVVNSGATAPTWTTLTLENIPGAWIKKAVKAASTANIATLAGGAPNTLDGVSLALNDRILVKDQTTTSQNGIYYVTTLGTGANGTWTRALDADAADEVAGATVSVDSGTTQFGQIWTTAFKPTDTLGTTAMLWYRIIDISSLSSATPAALGTAAAGTSTSVARADHIHSNAIDTILPSAAGATAALWNTTLTTGSISIGGALTGNMTIAGATGFAGTLAIANSSTSAHTISISNGAGTANKTINIGTAATGGTTAITLGSSSGATSTIQLNGAITGSSTLTLTGSTLNINGTNPTIATTQTTGTAAILNTGFTGGINIGQASTGTINIGSGTATVAVAGTLTSATVNSSAAGTAMVIGNTNTTGNITIGGALTSGTLTLGGTTTQTGQISIGNAATGSLTIAIGGGATANASTLAINVGTGATASGGTKNVNIATNGAAGSTTNVNIGSTTGTSTTTVLGTFKVGNTTVAQGVTGTITLPGAAGTLALNPTTTTGDIVYASTTATPATLSRLGLGTAGQALVVNSGATAPAWTTLTLENLPGAWVKRAVKAATTTNLTATYSNGTAGVGATLTNSGTLAALTLDGVTLAVNDRVLVKDQTTSFQNGIYTVTTVGSGAVAWVLTRALDADTPDDLTAAAVAIDQGTQGGFTYDSDFKATDTIGTTANPFYRLVDTNNKLSVFASTTSAELAGVISDETGSGSLVFGTAPTINNVVLTGTVSANASVGTNGQALLSTGTGVQWGTPTATPASNSVTLAMLADEVKIMNYMGAF